MASSALWGKSCFRSEMQDNFRVSENGSQKCRVLLTAICIALATALLVWRGLWRAVIPQLSDFAAPYAGSRAILAGENPYEHLEQILISAGADSGMHTAAVYPPATFVILLPFALFPAKVAKAVFTLAGLALYGFATGLCLKRVAKGYWKRWFFISIALAFAPLQTALHLSNPALVVASLTVIALVLEREYPKAGLPLGCLAFLLKPQLGIAYVLYLFFLRRWARVLVTVACYGLVTVGILGIHPNECIQWLNSWRANLVDEINTGSIALWGEVGFHRIDLSKLFWNLTHVSWISQSLPFAMAFSLSLFAFISGRRATNSEDEQKQIALQICASILACLMIGYHRMYDFILMLPVIAYMLLNQSSTIQSKGLILILIAVWLFPTSTVLYTLQLNHELPTSITDHLIYRYLLTQIESWVLFLLAVLAAVEIILFRRESGKLSLFIEPNHAVA